MNMNPERFVVSRTIAATPAEVFAVLVQPSRHRDTEPGDWVRDAIDAAPITGSGQVFAMNMYLTQAGGDYVTYNLVNVFDRDRAIGWMPGQLDTTGNHVAGGWWWRYDLVPSGGTPTSPSPTTGVPPRKVFATRSAGCRRFRLPT